MTRSRRLGLLAAAAVLCGACTCGEAGPLPRPSRQTIVAVDLSGSQTAATIQASRQFAEKTIEEISFGDQYVLMEMNREGVHGTLQRFEKSAPRLADSCFVSAADSVALRGTQSGFRKLVPMVFDTTLGGQIAHTDVFATLFTASQYVHAAGGRPTTIILLSDMLQSAGGIEMEGLKRMPDSGFIARNLAAGTTPDLRGVCIVVVGADASTADGVAVRNFWGEYFRAAGATFDSKNYVLFATSPGDLGCNGPGASSGNPDTAGAS